jgi:hypothetical protein
VCPKRSAFCDFISAWGGIFIDGKPTLIREPAFEISEELNDIVIEAFNEVAKEFL